MPRPRGNGESPSPGDLSPGVDATGDAASIRRGWGRGPPWDQRRLVALGLLLLLAVFVWLALTHLDRCLDDDAFISFRYARNLLRGEGLVYNPGERVEGYTNFLWVLLSAGAMALGAAPEAAAQLLGILFSAGTLVLLFRLGWRSFRSPWALVAPATLVSLLPFTVETLLGLEMALFIFLVVAGIAASAAEERGRQAVLTGIVLALAAMTRPEGLMVFGLTFVADVLKEGRLRTLPWRRWVWRALAFAAVFGPYYAWRYAYYGYPFPNTFYAKTGGGWFTIGLGVGYVGRALLHLGPLVLLGLALWWRRRDNPRWVTLVATLVVAYLGYLIVIGGDFRHHFRFFVPLLPLFALLGAAGARRLLRALPARTWVRVTGGALFAGVLSFAAVRMAGPALAWIRYREIRDPQLFAVGAYLRLRAPRGALLAISGAGIVPYVSDLPAIGMWGLTDEHIAHTPARRLGRGVIGHLKGDGAYILSRRPRYVLFIATMWTSRPATWADVGNNVAAPAELDLWRSRRFRALYRLRSARLPDGGFINYFERSRAEERSRAGEPARPSRR